jgi:hypothetical protein
VLIDGNKPMEEMADEIFAYVMKLIA